MPLRLTGALWSSGVSTRDRGGHYAMPLQRGKEGQQLWLSKIGSLLGSGWTPTFASLAWLSGAQHLAGVDGAGAFSAQGSAPWWAILGSEGARPALWGLDCDRLSQPVTNFLLFSHCWGLGGCKCSNMPGCPHTSKSFSRSMLEKLVMSKRQQRGKLCKVRLPEGPHVCCMASAGKEKLLSGSPQLLAASNYW